MFVTRSTIRSNSSARSAPMEIPEPTIPSPNARVSTGPLLNNPPHFADSNRNAAIRDVNRLVAVDYDGRGSRESGHHVGARAVGRDPDHPAWPSEKDGAARVLEHIQTAIGPEIQINCRLESRQEDRRILTWHEAVDARGPGGERRAAQLTDVVGTVRTFHDCRWNCIRRAPTGT